MSLLIRVRLNALLRSRQLLPRVVRVLNMITTGLDISNLMRLERPFYVCILLMILRRNDRRLFVRHRVPFYEIVFGLVVLLLFILLEALRLRINLRLSNANERLSITSSYREFYRINPNMFRIDALFMRLNRLIRVCLVNGIINDLNYVLPDARAIFMLALRVRSTSEISALIRASNVLPMIKETNMLTIMLSTSDLINARILLRRLLLCTAGLNAEHVLDVTRNLSSMT